MPNGRGMLSEGKHLSWKAFCGRHHFGDIVKRKPVEAGRPVHRIVMVDVRVMWCSVKIHCGINRLSFLDSRGRHYVRTALFGFLLQLHFGIHR